MKSDQPLSGRKRVPMNPGISAVHRAYSSLPGFTDAKNPPMAKDSR